MAGTTTRKPGRMGWPHYARMLQLVLAQPMQAGQVAQAMGHGVPPVRDVLWRMERAGIVHVSAWQQPAGHRGPFVPCFAGGPGQSKPYPRLPVPAKACGRRNCRSRSVLASFIALVRTLLAGDCTRRQLVEATGVAQHNIAPTLRQMRRCDMVHRSGWRRKHDGQHMWAEAFTWGPGADAPRPPTRCRLEILREYRAKRRAAAANQAALQEVA